MKRLALLLLVWFSLALGMAQAVPARPLYEPIAPPAPTPVVDLRDTTWLGKLYLDGSQVTFHANGTLTYSGGSPGTWRLTGNQLYFEINKWSEYQTTVTGDVIQGIGWNKQGQKCTPLLKRVTSANPPPVLRNNK